ncbi:MAG TPA: hypothetical protein VHX38_28070 [Pseudonocardiaceae bacterium]|nr:hypothetical protein [Pseudonocardiaceae bacterium]
MIQANSAVAHQPARAGFLHRFPEWLVVLCLGVGSALVFTIPFWMHPLFYYVGDNPQSFVPLWRHLGLLLRSGHWPSMEPSGWYGGNIAADSEFALWNPIGIVNDLIVSMYNNMASAAAFVQIESLSLIAMAIYLVAREYGAHRVPSVVVGFAMPACGFAVYYGASGWPAELTALIWVLMFWWGAHRMIRGRLIPLVPFVFGVLAITSGNPYAALGMIIVLIALGVEVLAAKNHRALWYLLGMGACAGAAAILTFYPLVEALPVSTRASLAAISNDMFMVPHLSDLVASSAPTYLPPIVNWNGAVIETVPSTYFIWFLVPLLPWLRWRTLRTSVKSLVSLCVFTGIFLALTVGPSNLWLFRWPIRLIDYFYAGVAVMFAVALSKGLAKDKVKKRAYLTAGLILGGAYLSYVLKPQFYTIHALATIIVAVLMFAALYVYRTRGAQALGAVLLLGTIAVFSYQGARLPVPLPGDSVQSPDNVAAMQAGTTNLRGTVLQLANVTNASTADMANGEIVFGNESLLENNESLIRYTGTGFDRFTSALCMDYRGDVCTGVWAKLWKPIPGSSVSLIDSLRVQSLVIERSLFPQQANATPPAGWQVEAKDNTRTLWVRTAPLPYPGRVSGASPGLRVTSAALRSDQQDQQINFTAPEQGGQLMLAQLDWPGYQATIDGASVPLHENSIGLITVNVPAGTHTLRLTFHDAGIRLGEYVLALVTLIALIGSVFWWRGNRRNRRKTGRPTIDESGPDKPDDMMNPVLTHAGPASDGN